MEREISRAQNLAHVAESGKSSIAMRAPIARPTDTAERRRRMRKHHHRHVYTDTTRRRIFNNFVR